MDPKWVVIYIAHGEECAKAAQVLLEQEGFVCRMHPIARTSPSEACYEVMALRSEAQEARDLLQENGL